MDTYRGRRVRFLRTDETLGLVSTEQFYRVVFVDPEGTRYDVTGRASSPRDAVALASETIDYVNRIGPITHHLEPDGLTARPPAHLSDSAITAEQAGPGFGLVITTGDGRTIRK